MCIMHAGRFQHEDVKRYSFSEFDSIVSRILVVS